MSGRSVGEIEEFLLGRLASYVDGDRGDLDPHLPFSYYGLDSLDAVALAAELEQWLGTPVAPDLAWDYPTAHAVAAYLSAVQPAEVDSDEVDATAAALVAELREAPPAG